jgi:valyl-tRNA synthetase
VRAEYRVTPGTQLTALVDAGSHRDLIAQHQYVFARLCNVREVTLIDSGAAPEKAAAVVVADVSAYLPLAELVDLDAERARLESELAQINDQLARSEALLSNENFVTRAKPEVVQRERDKLEALTASRQAVLDRLAAL